MLGLPFDIKYSEVVQFELYQREVEYYGGDLRRRGGRGDYVE